MREALGSHLIGREGTVVLRPKLEHFQKGATPGTVQVPANGESIVMRCNAQATEGYAKIAAVISAALQSLVHNRPRMEG